MAAITAALLCQLKTGDTWFRRARRLWKLPLAVRPTAAQVRHRRHHHRQRRQAAVGAAIRPTTRVFSSKPRQPERSISSDLAHIAAWPARRHHQRGRHSLRFAGAAAADGIRRGCGGLFRDQADGRAGPRGSAGRDLRIETLDRRGPDAVPAPTGPTLSAFNAWVELKGLETLPLRAHCAEQERRGTGPVTRTARDGARADTCSTPACPATRAMRWRAANGRDGAESSRWMSASGRGLFRNPRRARTGRYLQQ